jgi:hypothetical protein
VNTLLKILVACVASASSGPALWGQAPDPQRYAPVVVFHPAEGFFPEDPLTFIKASRFRHHKSSARDQGYSKARGGWVTTNSRDAEYFDIPVSVINSFTMENGRNRVPRHSNAGPRFNVFLQPEGRPTGNAAPEGQVPVFWRVRSVSGGEITHLIEYWFFFAYNDGPLKFNHQGDWEGIHVGLRNGVPIFCSLTHHGAVTRVPYGELEKITRSGSERVVVFCAKGSHAFYKAPGDYPIRLGTSDSTGRGRSWDTSRKLLPLAEQPWKDYAGAWGEIGDPWWGSDTSGPLGPWWKELKY